MSIKEKMEKVFGDNTDQLAAAFFRKKGVGKNHLMRYVVIVIVVAVRLAVRLAVILAVRVVLVCVLLYM